MFFVLLFFLFCFLSVTREHILHKVSSVVGVFVCYLCCWTQAHPEDQLHYLYTIMADKKWNRWILTILPGKRISISSNSDALVKQRFGFNCTCWNIKATLTATLHYVRSGHCAVHSVMQEVHCLSEKEPCGVSLGFMSFSQQCSFDTLKPTKSEIYPIFPSPAVLKVSELEIFNHESMPTLEICLWGFMSSLVMICVPTTCVRIDIQISPLYLRGTWYPQCFSVRFTGSNVAVASLDMTISMKSIGLASQLCQSIPKTFARFPCTCNFCWMLVR